jgi:hypothetical protein
MNSTRAAGGPVDAAAFDPTDICRGQCAEMPGVEFRMERSSVPVEGRPAQRPWFRWIVALAAVVVIGGYVSQLSVVQGLISQQQQTLEEVWQDAKSILAP